MTNDLLHVVATIHVTGGKYTTKHFYMTEDEKQKFVSVMAKENDVSVSVIQHQPTLAIHAIEQVVSTIIEMEKPT